MSKALHKNTRTYVACLLFVMVGMLIVINSSRKRGPRQADRIAKREQPAKVESEPVVEISESEEAQDVMAHNTEPPERITKDNLHSVAKSPDEIDDSGRGSHEPHSSAGTTEAHPASLGIASFSGSTVSGGAIIAGGWQEADGSRTFCLTSPRDLANSPKGDLEVSCIVLNIPIGASFDPTWNPLLESDTQGIHRNALSYDAPQFAELRSSLAAKQFSAMSSPRVTVADGGHGAVTMTSKDDGVLFSFVATRNSDNGHIEMSVSVARYKGMDPLKMDENAGGEE
jgi:hypothetical protein